MKKIWGNHQYLRMLSGVFIVLALLLGTSLYPAYAQDPVEDNAAAQISFSGWFSIIWGDSKDGKSSMIYTLTDENGQRTILQLDKAVIKNLGGVIQFYGKFVNVLGNLPPASNKISTFDSTQNPPAVLNVKSISLASPPKTKAPIINDVNPDVIVLAAVSGSHPWITIMCKFSDRWVRH